MREAAGMSPSNLAVEPTPNSLRSRVAPELDATGSIGFRVEDSRREEAHAGFSEEEASEGA